MKLVVLIAAAAALLPVPCAAGYNKMRIGKSGGYKEKQLAPNSWKIRAMNRAIWVDNPDFATDMALFRGAVRSKAAGYRIMHVVNFTITNEEMFGRMFGTIKNQEVRLTVTATNDPAEPLRCQAKLWVENCRILDVDEVLSVKGYAMQLGRQEIDEEVASAKAMAPRASDAATPGEQ
jgi:hypothetical protein